MAGFFLIILLIIIMIWGELEYTLGGLIVAIVFVVLGLMGLFKWADSGTESNKQKAGEKHQTTHGSGSSYNANFHDDDDTDNAGRLWDNSQKAGGMPRYLSPFSDMDDPYDRAELEWDMLDEEDGFRD